MITYDESIRILKQTADGAPYLESEQVSLLHSVGRILTEDITARENNPPFDNSAMDGFAINVESLNTLTELIPVQTRISAGDGDIRCVKKLGAVEIMTGAPIPNSYFNSVVRVEDVEQIRDENGKRYIRVNSLPAVGDNIRRAGEDTKVGTKLLDKGQRITNEHLLAIATQGISKLKVKKQIRIGILSTGKEIVNFENENLGPGQIRNSTGVYIEAALSAQAYTVKNYGVIQDDPSIYIESLKRIFIEDTDILISTGAVSMGVYDFVRPALESIGAKIHFHKCAIRPGKPILFSSITLGGKTKFIFGIPGNPVSTAVGLKFFVKPFLNFLLTGEMEMPTKAILEADTKKPLGLKCFFKAKLKLNGSEAVVESLMGQASFMVSPLIQSNAWVVLPEEEANVEKGTKVEVFTL